LLTFGIFMYEYVDNCCSFERTSECLFALAYPAGCVLPKAIPTLSLPISEYGSSAAMIRWAQQNLSGKWGLQSAKNPLTRLGNTTQAKANRRVVCETDWRALPKKVQDDSCDEYPFAGSKQSAGLIPGFKTGADCAQVIAVKDKAGQWTGVVPLGQYSASGKCVRGHIPLSLNTKVGRAYGGLVRSERLLPGDPFWVAVTS
jgi:hypothetical protein